MPRYDYECGLCHHRFELKQSFDSEPVAKCPVCESTARRKFHSVPVVFKGSGWYVNDYGKKGSASTSAANSKDSSESKGKTDGESSSVSDGKSKSDGESSSAAKTESKVGTGSAKGKDD